MRCLSCPFSTPVLTSNEVKPANLMIVGEAPGKTEIKMGKCFVGPPGRLLDQTLQSFKIDRSKCSVTNALSCYIPKEIYDKKAAYMKEPCTSCRPRLIQEIIKTRPKAILALGNVAMQSILQDFGLKITQERGKVITFTISSLEQMMAAEGMPSSTKAPYQTTTSDYEPFTCMLMSTLHPAAVLRNPVDFKKFKRDIAYAYHLAQGGIPKSPGETNYEVIWKPSDVPSAIARIKEYALSSDRPERLRGVIGADIETDSLDPIHGDILALGMAYGPNRVTIFRRDCLNSLHALLGDHSLKWVWHNGKFDTKFLQKWGLPARVDHDTMLLHYATDEQKGTHDLKQLSTYLLGAADYSGEFKKFLPERGMTFADAPDDALHTYLSKDCDYTYQIFDILDKQVNHTAANADLSECYNNLLIPFSDFLTKVEQRGIWVNPDYIDGLEKELIAERITIIERINLLIVGWWDELDYAFDTKAGSIPEEFNPGSWQQLKWILYTSMGLRPTNGLKNTAEETLASIDGSPFVDAIMELRKVDKKLGTYVKGMKEAVRTDGRIHATYMIHGTQTGRLSSNNPNMQNIPRERYIKDVFQAPEGKYLIDMDLGQAELRTLAAMSNDEVLKEVFNSGRDLHSETAEGIYGPTFTKEHRVRAKAVNFGICYGLTEYSLMMSFGITFGEANKMIMGWANSYPDAWKFLQDLRKIPQQGKYAVSPFGRRRRFPLVTKDALNGLQNEASNFAIQATASDINVLTAIELDRRLIEHKNPLINQCMIINLVHDSTIVEVPEDLRVVKHVIIEAQRSLDYIVTKWLKTDVKFSLSGDYGKTWGNLSPMELN